MFAVPGFVPSGPGNFTVDPSRDARGSENNGDDKTVPGTAAGID